MLWKLGSILSGSAVMMGAFGSHGLKSYWATLADGFKRQEYWNTAVQYQLIHSIGLLLYSLKDKSASMRWPGVCFVLGIVCFSGSLYLLSVDKDRAIARYIWPVTPLGGLFFIAGWAGLALL